MEDLALRTRLSVLWLMNTMGGVSLLTLEFYEPGVIDQVRSGVKGGMTLGSDVLLLFSILFNVSLVMAFVSQTLKPKVGRWTNIVIGAIYTVLTIAILVPKLEAQSVLAINPAVGLVFSALVVWYAYKWPKI